MSEGKSRIDATITPWTYKGILGAAAGAFTEIARALDRIATEYERRGKAHGSPGGTRRGESDDD